MGSAVIVTTSGYIPAGASKRLGFGAIYFVISDCFYFLIQRSTNDSSNFDDDFTFQPAQLTPTDAQLVLSIDQNNFAGFSFTSDRAM